MAEWLIEYGIGEDRAMLVEGERVLASKLHWPGEIFAGQIVEAKLVSRAAGSSRGTAVTQTGSQILLDRIPKEVTEGSMVEVAITRPPIAEIGRTKLAQGRVTDGLQHGKNSSFDGLDARAMPGFPSGLWEDIWHTASSGQVDFAGGSAIFSATPAMTLIDIDGEGSPKELSLAAIPAIAQGLAWFDLGGNIGIDFPTIEAKSDRKAVDSALAKALDHWPHERTAMNGFGFVQIVARLVGPSLVHRFASSRTGMCARYALRVAERAEGAGVTLLTVHPAIKAKLKPEWLDELRRRTGRELRVEADPGLALEAPSAQVIGS